MSTASLAEALPLAARVAQLSAPARSCMLELVPEEDVVASGVGAAASLASELGLEVVGKVSDSELVKRGEPLLELRGCSRALLLVEPAMRLMIAMACSIATKVRRAKAKLAPSAVALPLQVPYRLYELECRAVEDGGGLGFRRDVALISALHLKLSGGAKRAAERAQIARKLGLKVAVEAPTLRDIMEAAELADIIVVKSMGLAEAAVEAVRELGLRTLVELQVAALSEAEGCRRPPDIVSSLELLSAKPAPIASRIHLH
ncbi:MAG: hypothetical protein DRN96_05390 [Thermoproteota archaeon]|nr:MAG: hypothetical protein DRN96_05390 [Candidatus Korarchaeota archaeon]